MYHSYSYGKCFSRMEDKVMFVWFICGCYVGFAMTVWTNRNAYEKGYQEGRNFERWLRR